jgi:hypothetical protein
MTPQETIAALQKQRDAMLDPMDVPRTWTQRQADAYEQRRAALDAHAQAIHVSLHAVNKPTQRLAVVTATRDRLLAVEAMLEKQIADAPDPRSVGGEREQTKEMGRQKGLADSLKALREGVEHLNGEPLLPGLLRQALTDTCPTCGHSTFAWPGPLVQVEREVREAERKVSELRTSLESNLRSAQALLAADALTV